MKIQKIFLSCFELFYILVMSVLMFVVITGTQRNIEWYNILFVTSVLFIAMLFLYAILAKMEKFLICYTKNILICFVAIWGIALYIFCYIFQNNPCHDYINVYDSALAMANGSSEIDWAYFARFKNNFLATMIVAVLMKIAFCLGLSEPIAIMLLFSVAMVLWSGICIFKLLETAGYSYSSCFMGILLFAAFVPLWGGSFNLYTDCISLSFSIWACYIISRGKKKAFNFVIAGILWGIGYAIKPTVIISMVAIFLIMLLTDYRRKIPKVFLGVLIGFLLSQMGVELLWNQFPCAEIEEEYAAPFEYWFALGLCGNGSDAENGEFAIRCLDASGLEAKKQIAREHIAENIEELWNVDHLVQKARHNFASGHMGLPDFNRYPINIMYHFFNDWGIYGGYAVMYTSGYFYALLLFGLLSSFLHFKDYKQGKEVPLFAIIGRLVMFGLVIFLMLFEANNRQLYNHMPWFAVIGVTGCERVGLCLISLKTRMIGKGTKEDRHESI